MMVPQLGASNGFVSVHISFYFFSKAVDLRLLSGIDLIWISDYKWRSAGV